MNNSDEKIQNEILEKIGKEPNLDKLDLKSIDENSLNDLINKKSSEIEEEGIFLLYFALKYFL